MSLKGQVGCGQVPATILLRIFFPGDCLESDENIGLDDSEAWGVVSGDEEDGVFIVCCLFTSLFPPGPERSLFLVLTFYTKGDVRVESDVSLEALERTRPRHSRGFKSMLPVEGGDEPLKSVSFVAFPSCLHFL